MTRSAALFFFFKDTATTEIYTLSLHDALPIFSGELRRVPRLDARLREAAQMGFARAGFPRAQIADAEGRSEEHTSELQSLTNLVCRLLLEKKKTRRKCSCGPWESYTAGHCRAG